MSRNRFVYFASILSLSAAACGGGGTSDPDAAGELRLPLQAWTESNDVFTEQTLDTSCLNTPTADEARTEEIILNTTVTDFQTDDPLPGATVTWFDGTDTTAILGTGVSDEDGNIAVTLPAGGEPRFGFKMVEEDSYDTFLLNQYVQPSGSPQTSPSSISAVSFGTGAALPALVGISRTPGTGVLAGALRDCQLHELSNFTATVSSVSGTKMPLPGARSFYFQNGLPARNTVVPIANKDGLFALLELPPSASAYVQMWGYLNQADADAGRETLLSELPVPIIADNMVTGSYELQRN
jgi:hypothetical protein